MAVKSESRPLVMLSEVRATLSLSKGTEDGVEASRQCFLCHADSGLGSPVSPILAYRGGGNSPHALALACRALFLQEMFLEGETFRSVAGFPESDGTQLQFRAE